MRIKDILLSLIRNQMTVYILVTTSLFNDCKIREQQYRQGISSLQKHVANTDYKVIIIENNGKRNTFLDDFGYDVLYTGNNSLPIENKGVKELRDIFDCISIYDIQDDDFIVKMTGRYVLENTSDFFTKLQLIKTNTYDCIIRYGSYCIDDIDNINDCITGLIGMRCKYILNILNLTTHECVEWKWAEATHAIPTERLCKLPRLGINMWTEHQVDGIV